MWREIQLSPRWLWLIAIFFADPAFSQVSGNAFNPAISMILDGKFSSYSIPMEEYDFPGFPLAPGSGPPPEGFSLGESELVLSSNVDDYFFGTVTLALDQDADQTEVELEEAWIQTLALPAGFSVKAGRFLSDIGYHNSRHPHAWDFVDAPLPYEAMLGGAVSDTGVQARWLAPTDLMIELGAELLRGDSYPAAGGASSGTGAWTTFARLGADLGVSQSWRLGVFYLAAQAQERESLIGEVPAILSGEGSVAGLDLVWKWAENGNPKLRNAVVQAEYLLRDEDGLLDAGGLVPGLSSPYELSQSGFYVQGTYQFMPGWRAGLRYDRLTADNAAMPPPLEELLQSAGDPQRWSAMLDYSHSEFSRLRFQLASLDSGTGSETQLFVQYIMSLGAHGAHQF